MVLEPERGSQQGDVQGRPQGIGLGGPAGSQGKHDDREDFANGKIHGGANFLEGNLERIQSSGPPGKA